MVEHDTNTRDSLENSKGKRLQRTAAVPVLEKLGEYAVEPDLLTAFEGSLMREPSVERHTALLAGASTDAQRASLAIHLQQTYGNQYVQRLVESIEVQAKLTVSSPDDEYEREADRVADAVTRAPASSVQRQESEESEEEEPEVEVQAKISRIQRQAEEPEEEEGEEEEETVQTKLSESQPNTVSKDLEAGIKAARGTGQPLPDSIRNSFEPRFGHDFGQVRIHTDAKADTLSRQLSAEAFTTGNDVFFRDGAYRPGSDSGKKLITHELTHVVQQQRAPLAIQEAEGEGAVLTAQLGGGTHTVVQGDTLWDIAKNTYGDGSYWRKIYESNQDRVGDGGNLILIDTVLELPVIEVPVASAPSATEQTPAATEPPTSESKPAGEKGITTTSPLPGGTARARPCLLPSLKYQLSGLPSQTTFVPMPTGLAELKLSFTGDLTLQQIGTCSVFTLDQNGYEFEAENVFNGITSSFKTKLSGEGLGITSEIAGEFGSTSISFKPPNTLVYSCEAKPVSTTYENWQIKGKIGFELEFTYTPSIPEPVPWYEKAWDWISDNAETIAGVALIVGSGVVVVVTVGEDIVTLGAGLADDPVSFVAAAAMFNQGLQYVH